jgi:hypothetical protein
MNKKLIYCCLILGVILTTSTNSIYAQSIKNEIPDSSKLFSGSMIKTSDKSAKEIDYVFIAGQLRDDRIGSTLRGSVVALSSGQSFITGDDGIFTMTVPVGSLLSINVDGYLSVIVNILPGSEYYPYSEPQYLLQALWF